MNQREAKRLRFLFEHQKLEDFGKQTDRKQVHQCLGLLRYDFEHFDPEKDYFYFFTIFSYLSKAITFSLQEQKKIYEELQLIRRMTQQRISDHKKDSHYKLFLKILGKIEILSLELSQGFDESYEKSKRELLYQLLFEIRNLQVAKHILSKLPHQTNILEPHGFQLAMDLFQKYVESLQNYVTKSEQFDEVIYYDRLLLYFFTVNQNYMTGSLAKKFDHFLEHAENFSCFHFSQKEIYCYYIHKWRQFFLSFLTPTHSVPPEITEKELMYQFHIQKDFSQGLFQEANFLFMRYGERKRTKDMPSIYTVDGELTRDRDDGFSCKKDESHYRLGIHITCPVYYMDESSLIMEEGTRRAATIYFDQEILASTFPPILANQLFSLEEHHVRYCFSSYYDIDLKAKKITNIEFLIEPVFVQKNDTYEHCNQVLSWGSRESTYQTTLENIQELLPFLKSFFRIDDTYAQVHETTHPKICSSAQDMIETLMIFQNHEIARAASALEIPLLYRNHEMSPVYKQNLMELKQRIAKEKTNQIYLHEIQVALGQYPKSYYGVINQGHFGLGMDMYTHFTSPDRRIADDYNMLMFQKFFFAQGSHQEKEKYRGYLTKLAAYLNARTHALRMFEKEYGILKKEKNNP